MPVRGDKGTFPSTGVFQLLSEIQAADSPAGTRESRTHTLCYLSKGTLARDLVRRVHEKKE